MTLVKFLGFSYSSDTVENPIPSTSCIIEMWTISIIYFWGGSVVFLQWSCITFSGALWHLQGELDFDFH